MKNKGIIYRCKKCNKEITVPEKVFNNYLCNSCKWEQEEKEDAEIRR